ncbi:Zinc finger CCCH domain-containing protein 4 [Vitis vinifera]|uniref:Zinc finger CCCH domain-containing protein 4 n=1 Tax=Vitis vinifera TaxID=29760 RepID=A0A438F3G3_VITVI|nr:Zinc finger CCCH domain-containing protein 4 [Vitis vinifera]
MAPILCTQPRRFAVVAVARMVAKARNSEVGGEVGYHIGHSKLLSERVAQLVRANTRKCSPSKWHMVLGSNVVTDDALNLLGVGCRGVVSTPRFGSPWRVLRAWPWKVPRL